MVRRANRTGINMKKWLFVVVVLCASVGAQAQEWTRFRGPNGSGVAAPCAGIPAQFGASDLNWKIELPGVGHSSPSIWGNRVFVTCSDVSTARRTLLCINSADGVPFWKK